LVRDNAGSTGRVNAILTMKWRQSVISPIGLLMTDFQDPDRALAIAYAQAACVQPFTAVWHLDEAIGQSVAQTSEPALAQIRLAWWRETIEQGRWHEHPALQEISVVVPQPLLLLLPALADAWEPLLAPFPLAREALLAYARDRGGALADVMTQLAGAPADAARRLGEGWALTDFARRCSDHETATRALTLAHDRLDRSAIAALPRGLLPLALLAHLARLDARSGLPLRHPVGGRARALRVLLFAIAKR
jgi:15-cis-phytoene synthase